jgi:hypothetical protein
MNQILLYKHTNIHTNKQTYFMYIDTMDFPMREFHRELDFCGRRPDTLDHSVPLKTLSSPLQSIGCIGLSPTLSKGVEDGHRWAACSVAGPPPKQP